MTRILILNERDPAHPKAGGAEVHVSEIFRRLAARGHAVVQLSSRFRRAARGEVEHGIEVRRPAGMPAYYPAAALACARATRRGEFDVVVDCLNKLPFLSPLYARAPVLALCHHLFGETAFEQVAWPIAACVVGVERCIPRVYRSARFVAISESTRDDLVRRGVDPGCIEVHHPGIAAPSLPAPPPSERPKRIVYVGRLERYKNVDVLIRAVAALRERLPAVELVVVGSGADRGRLEALCARSGIADRVRFTGFVSDAERNALLASARVCACASSKEGWGLTVIESNALGTPNVASDAPGLRDSVRDGETGFLVPVGDVAGFVDRIGRLLTDDGLALRMSQQATAWAQRFTWDEAARRMETAIETARKAVVQ